MAKIVEYDSKYNPTIWGLTTAINEAIKEGWQPFGATFVCGTCFYQALVKYEEQTDESD
jgi:hypothetical protein